LTNGKSAIFSGLFIVGLFLLATSVDAQNALAHYLIVAADENILDNPQAEKDSGVGNEVYVIDGNESKGYVNLFFRDSYLPSGKPREIHLLISIPDKKWADSETGFQVFLDGKAVGSVKKFPQKTTIAVPLSVPNVASLRNCKLTVKASGDDGFYIMSQVSGFGAVIKLTY